MSNDFKYADIAPAVPVKTRGRQTYTYKIPSDMNSLRQYSQVSIPFGSRKINGLVMKLHNQRPRYPLKEITRHYPVELTSNQIKFAKWICDTTQGSLGYTLRLFQPSSLTLYKPTQPQQGPKASPASSKLGQEVIDQVDKQDVAIIESDTKKRQQVIDSLASLAVEKGQQLLVLVPELWMAEQYKNCTVYHTKLKTSEKKEIWHRIKSGQPIAIVGTQKSLFLPWQKLAFIVIEEEYLPTHKLWDQYPRLHNIDAAQVLASIHQCHIFYSTSLPSIRLYHQVKEKQVKQLVDHPMETKAKVLRYAFEDKLKHYKIPNELIKNLNKWIKGNEKILLFYNRRDATQLKDLISRAVPRADHKHLRIETSSIFSKDPTAKFDRVIWLFPERELSYPDHRSQAKALITLHRLQLTLNKLNKKVIVISKIPEIIERDILRPIDTLYFKILKERKRLSYPPFNNLVRLTVTANKSSLALKRAEKVRQSLDSNILRLNRAIQEDISVFGPFQSLEQSTKENFDFHIVVTGHLTDIKNIYANETIDRIDLSPQRIL